MKKLFLGLQADSNKAKMASNVMAKNVSLWLLGFILSGYKGLAPTALQAEEGTKCLVTILHAMGICIVAATHITPFSPWREDEGWDFAPSLSDRR
ncbi:hypothetical protein HMPREF1991_01334 [Hoylesella loescheii DSM 19665 = JCM 12249 = ATCC 15930]|uniref:Uncharacterized protein n=1 Tax=Hoylesella loescheii DSM 19665 = JCM 12249 = ATCC 15930 TaxID=1122985 RepID=A0A069QKP0_HOYLO|nr:hypothetical protein HMPREF1991_01334 [Hoylesella loescheii DSM 19665 = JCM 12249 = ATCC 15930]